MKNSFDSISTSANQEISFEKGILILENGLNKLSDEELLIIMKFCSINPQNFEIKTAKKVSDLVKLNVFLDRLEMHFAEQTIEKAFKIIFDRHYQRVYKYALRRLAGQKNLAEEAAQIVFWKLYQKKENYRPEHSALAWIYIISKSETKDLRIKEKRHVNHGELEHSLNVAQTSDAFKQSEVKDFAYYLSQNSSSNPSNIQERLEQEDWVNQTLSCLPEKERQILQRRILDNEDYQDLSESLGLSQANLRQIVSRSLKFLKNKMNNG